MKTLANITLIARVLPGICVARAEDGRQGHNEGSNHGGNNQCLC